ncbi:MAG TPA: 4Fe-4S ferredoxin, partial [Candidatus Limnocylindria bacterium]
MAGQMSRRQLLGTLGGLGTGVLAAGFVPIAFAEAQAAETGPKRQWAMVIDLRKCDGCKACTKACQETHHLPESFEWIKVFEVHDKQGGSFF